MNANDALHRLEQQKFALDQHAIVAITDPKGTITYANDKFVQISGYSRSELLGQNHRLLNSGHHPKQFFTEMYQTISQGQVWRAEVCNRAKGGQLYWVDTTVVPFVDENGNVIEYIAIRAEITARKKAEEELIVYREYLQELVSARTAEAERARHEAERANQSKSEFLANMSHELRTPMHAILAFARLGREKLAAADVPVNKLRDYFEHINRSGERLIVLINDLLDLSKLEAGKMLLDMHEHDLSALVRGVADEFDLSSKEKGISINLESIPPNLRIECDGNKIGQVLRNLLSNAINFSPDKGCIRICVSDTELPGPRAADLTHPCVQIRVEDEGIGIPEGELEDIFNPFIQSSKSRSGAGGTGLGLAICREVVELHGGTIHAENNPVGGASLFFLLPAKYAQTRESR